VEERVYSRFDPEKMDFEFGNDGDLRFIMCIRTPVDDFDEFIPGNSFSVRMNPNRKIIDINPCLHTLDEHNWEYELDVFERFWFDFPTPFHKGDILWDPESFSGPFVCTGINRHQFNDEKAIFSFQSNRNKFCMPAYGLFVSAAYGVYAGESRNYMNCEYISRELTGYERLLPFRAYEKGEADVELLVHALHYMRTKIEQEYCGLQFHTAEVLKKWESNNERK